MKLNATQRSACRICGGAAVQRFLDFADYPLSDNLLDRPGSPQEYLARYQAFWCPDCGTAQNLTDFDWSQYYRGYDYTVSASRFAQTFMQRLAENAIARYGLPPGATVVEIGSSDGYQLACFKERGLRVFGYEPGEGLAAAANARGVPTTTALFGDDTLGALPADFAEVNVFLSSYTFDHLPDPVGCLRAMRGRLDPQRGLVIIEVHDLEQIIARREACLFCHEHTIYLSWQSMARLMQRAGLKLVSTDLVPEAQRRGNSLLVVGVADSSPIAAHLPAPTPLLTALDSWPAYEHFGAAVAQAHQRLGDYVRTRVAAGQRLAGYGASARAISTLALAGLDQRHLAYVCDVNTSLHGKYLPRSHVPIVPPQHVLEDARVDEVLVFAYGYLTEIRAALAPLTARGGRLTSLLDLLAAPGAGESRSVSP